MNPDPFAVWSAVADWRSLAVRALRRMYLPDQHLFAFRLRRDDQGGFRLEGISGRYTAIALIALAGEPDDVAREIFGGETAHAICGHLIARADTANDLGEVALTLWAARALEHPAAHRVLKRLQSFSVAAAALSTVELAWSLTALVVTGSEVGDAALAGAVAERLLSTFEQESGLFSHWQGHKDCEGSSTTQLRISDCGWGTRAPAAGSSIRNSQGSSTTQSAIRNWSRHVCCFADLVYPIQALSYYHIATGDRRALQVAGRCAEMMVALQGPQGQWWWHYDVRTGRVVERFPVYAVHQDAMGPMALFALADAGGVEYQAAIERSVQWLMDPPESDGPLVDTEADVIWRKVARHEPGKLARTLQAVASRMHPSWRVPGLDVLLRPGWIDYESRPYHMGWLLHAFTAERVARYAGELRIANCGLRIGDAQRAGGFVPPVQPPA